MADDELRNALAGDSVVGSDGRSYEVEPYRNPLASSNFKQFEWAKNNPQIASPLADLLKYLSFMPMGRSTAGARIGHDNVMAGRLDRRADRIDSMDPGITGAQGARGLGVYNPIYTKSATGMMSENPDAILPTTRDLAPYYPTPRDYPTAVNDPRFSVIPGGKKD